MYKILGLRVNAKTGKKTDTFHEKNWGTLDFKQIFNNYSTLLAPVVDVERYNLYFTVADCGIRRELMAQELIPFDIDGLDLPEDLPLEECYSRAKRATEIALGAIGFNYFQTPTVFSGNGVQFFIHSSYKINNITDFEIYRPHYKILCDRINEALKKHGIAGRTDTSVWSPARLMRMPGTLNKKEGKPTREAVVLQSNCEEVHFDFVELCGNIPYTPHETVSKEHVRRFFSIDTPGVVAECEFLKWQYENQTKVDEPQWYAAISVLSYLDDGNTLCHKYSEGHPKYSFLETEDKIAQAQAQAGPRTCKDISTRWDGCSKCKHYGKLTTPLQIVSENFIKTAKNGYREIIVDKTTGQVKLGKIVLADIVKAFCQEFTFIYVGELQSIYIYNGKFWEAFPGYKINNWVHAKLSFDGKKPSSAEVSEVREALFREKVISREEFFSGKNLERKMNFQNGILDTKTWELIPHSPIYGFDSILPYAYDPSAKAPLYKKFMQEICADDLTNIETLNEFGGYCLSGDPCHTFTASIFMIGEGANGKSVWADVLRHVMGRENTASASLDFLDRPEYAYSVVRKLVNVSEETSVNALRKSDTFKRMVDGGEMHCKQFYIQPFTMENRAKLVVLANEMPEITDMSHGTVRRIIPIFFNQRFSIGDNADTSLREKLYTELPGICNIFIKSYKKALERGYFTNTFRAREQMEVLKKESNAIVHFIDVHIEKAEGPGGIVDKNLLYETFCRWCKEISVRPIRQSPFFKDFKRFCPYPITEAREMKQGTRTRKLVGIKLKANNQGVF